MHGGHKMSGVDVRVPGALNAASRLFGVRMSHDGERAPTCSTRGTAWLVPGTVGVDLKGDSFDVLAGRKVTR